MTLLKWLVDRTLASKRIRVIVEERIAEIERCKKEIRRLHGVLIEMSRANGGIRRPSPSKKKKKKKKGSKAAAKPAAKASPAVCSEAGVVCVKRIL
jgi:hypothetical protein